MAPLVDLLQIAKLDYKSCNTPKFIVYQKIYSDYVSIKGFKLLHKHVINITRSLITRLSNTHKIRGGAWYLIIIITVDLKSTH